MVYNHLILTITEIKADIRIVNEVVGKPLLDIFLFVTSANDNLNVIFSFCREINGEKKNFCLVTNPRKKLKYRMFTEAES